jgi:hypothetical protein
MSYISNGSHASSRTLSGASLAQKIRRMTPPQRAVMAAEILDGALIVQNLTAKSIVMIVNANMAYVCAALRSTPEQRELVKRGQRPLIPTRARALRAPAAIDWHSVDDAALTETVRSIGIERTLSALALAERTTQ